MTKALGKRSLSPTHHPLLARNHIQWKLKEETKMKAQQQSTLALLEIALGVKRNTVAGDELATFPLKLVSTQILILTFSHQAKAPLVL